MHEIERENQRLLQKLSQIMSVNRVENFWKQPHPNFLNRVYIKTPPPPSKQRRRAQSVPPPSSQKSIITNHTTSSELRERQQDPSHTPPVKSRSCMRCPTCSGKPIATNVVNNKKKSFLYLLPIWCLNDFIFVQVIPEERVPFAPPRKSWNQKLMNDKSKIHRCCKLCC